MSTDYKTTKNLNFIMGVIKILSTSGGVLVAFRGIVLVHWGH